MIAPQRVGQEPAATPGESVAGYFGPFSATWSVHREGILHVGGWRAVLMQLAHPKVAQGVADHSRFRRAPMSRAMQTYRTANALIFGDCRTATAASERLYQIHQRVGGRLRSRVPGIDDPAYCATDQELLVWVHFTLVDSVMLVHDTFLGTMTPDDWAKYYQESKTMARLFGIEPACLPEDVPAFRETMDSMLSSPEITVTDTAREIVDSLRRRAWYLRPFESVHTALTVALLPRKLRSEYGFEIGPLASRASRIGAAAIRSLVPRVPRTLRTDPHYWAAAWRCLVRSADQRDDAASRNRGSN